MSAFWIQNIVAHWLQAGLLVVAAAAVAALLRLRHPSIRVVFWQAVLALLVMLPALQPWQQMAASVLFEASPVLGPGDAVTFAANGVASAPAWPTAVLAILAAGVVLRLASIGLGLVRLNRLRRLPSIGHESRDEVEATMGELGVRAAVRISATAGPLSFGAWRPVIVLPDSFQALDRQGRRAVALHEAIHVRRRDWVAALLEELAVALLWFHPWSWWLRVQIRLAREEAVDRETVARLGAREPYAACLLTIAGYQVDGTSAGVALLRRHELRHRLEALFQEVTMSPARYVATVAVLWSVLMGAAAAAVAAFPLSAAPAERRVLHLVPPEYPADAQSAGVTGTVTVELTVNAKGEVTAFTVAGGPAQLQAATMTAVRQWKFEPGSSSDVMIVEVGYELAVRDGEKVPSWSFTVRPGSTTPAPLRAGGDVVAPKVRKEVHPVYSAEMITTGAQGNVVVEATVGADGRVTDAEVVRFEQRFDRIDPSSVPELHTAALDAVRQWEFEPGTRNGVPVAVLVEIEFTFRLK